MEKENFLPENRRLLKIEQKMSAIYAHDYPLNKHQLEVLEVANLQWLRDNYFHGNMPTYAAERKAITKRYV
jgi:hypothetical protein